MRKRRRSGTTRLGQAVGALTMLVAGAAFNTGANLLFLILGLTVACQFVAVRRTRNSLASITLGLEVPALIEAGAGYHGTVTVAGRDGLSLLARGDLLPVEGVAIPPGTGVVRIGFRAGGASRGIRREATVELSTRWPLHLFERRREFVVPIDTHIFPALPEPRAVEFAPAIGASVESARVGDGGDLRDLRPMVAGDSLRRLHWRTSARLRQWVVREDHDLDTRLVRVSVRAHRDGLEAALSRAAGQVRDALRAGARVRLDAGDISTTVDPAEGAGVALRLLAGIEPFPVAADGRV